MLKVLSIVAVKGTEKVNVIGGPFTIYPLGGEGGEDDRRVLGITWFSEGTGGDISRRQQSIRRGYRKLTANYLPLWADHKDITDP